MGTKQYRRIQFRCCVQFTSLWKQHSLGGSVFGTRVCKETVYVGVGAIRIHIINVDLCALSSKLRCHCL